MRARIVFRGLTLFTFRDPSKEAAPGDNLGPMTAWLISDPMAITPMTARKAMKTMEAVKAAKGMKTMKTMTRKGKRVRMAGMARMHRMATMAGMGRMGEMGRTGGMEGLAMPQHVHKPYWQVIARDVGMSLGQARNMTRDWIPAVSTIELKGHGAPTGVRVDGSFLDYVPCLSTLHGDPVRQHRDIVGALAASPYVTSRINIPSGTIRARNFISWDFHGNTPAIVAYMGTPFQGYGANEVIVEFGNDSDLDGDVPTKYLSVTGEGVNTVQARLDPADRNDVAARLWPRAKAEVDDEVAANTVEMLVTNLAPRRETPSISGPHFVSMFEAAGFPDMPSYKRTKQFQDFKNVAQNYYPDQWSDLEVMGLTQPFPFLVDINPDEQTLAKIDNTRGPGALTDHLPPAHDPWNSQICPFGRE